MFHSIPKKESTVVPPVREKIEKFWSIAPQCNNHSLSLHATTSILQTLLTVTGRKENQQHQWSHFYDKSYTVRPGSRTASACPPCMIASVCVQF
jgi:hypothetical protein